MNRTQCREQALFLVFQECFSPELSIDEIIKINTGLVDDEQENPDGEEEVKVPDFVYEPFTVMLANSVKDNMEHIDDIISGRLIKWTIDRLPKISLCILRLAIAEILFANDASDAVVANEAVNLAKKYIGEKEAKFINGVIGSVIHEKNSNIPELAKEVPADEAVSGTSEDNQ